VNLVKTTFLSIIASGTKVISALALNKILALYVGPAGYAMVGQLQNIITSVTALASAGVNTGIVKYTAEYTNDSEKRIRLWQTAGTIGFCGTVLVSTLLVIFSNKLSLIFFSSLIYGYIIRLTAICLFLYVLNTLLISILNGLGNIKEFTMVNIFNSIASLLLTAGFAYYWGLNGALISLAIGQSVVVFFTIILIRKKEWVQLSYLWGKVDNNIIKKLVLFTIATLVTSLLGPLVQSAIRGLIMSYHNMSVAGYWDAMTRISNTYLMVITFPLNVYFVPKISASVKDMEVRNIVWGTFKVLFPLTIFCCVAIFLCRDLIIKLLFTNDFLPMRSLFGWQLAGDIVRVCCWICSYYFIAKAQIKIFIAAEIFINVVYLTEVFLLKNLDVIFVPISYFWANISYLILMVLIYFYKRQKFISLSHQNELTHEDIIHHNNL
jgi:PST family polysaccharide transporter